MAELTDSQRLLVEENHNLIYGYANKKNLNVYEYYDILAIGLCKAASAYDSSKGSFSNFAYFVMENEVKYYWRKITNASALPYDLVLSYDSYVRESECAYIETIPAKNDDISFQARYNELLSKMTDEEKTFCQLIMNGMRHADVMDVMGITRGKLLTLQRQVRRKYEKMWR